MEMINVLVVEDSPTTREFLVHLFDSDPAIRVVGTAADGEEALVAARRLNPDIITMDIRMPGMDGLEATRRIMETQPVPIVIVSGNVDPGETTMTFRALQAGALAVIPRPYGIGHSHHEMAKRELLQTVKLMAEVKVVRRWPRRKTAIPVPPLPNPESTAARIRLVAIGASTGGPPVLQTILSGLSERFPVPVLIVQHIAVGFVQGFVDWLNGSSRLPIQVAAQGDPVRPGHAYVAPDGFQMGIGRNGTIALSPDRPEKGHCPSVSHLFRSVAEVFGANAAGVLLTGMGADGAEALRLMRDQGAITIAQDKESSVVYGMPGAAVELGAAAYVLSPGRIVIKLQELVKTGERL